MNVETAAKTIQLILAPVVMVSACGILLTGMLSHYGAVNDRIRRLTSERLGLSQLAPAEDHLALAQERVLEIDHQVPMLLRRHNLVHWAILLAETSVVILVLSMFMIAMAALSNSSATGTAALMVFLVATAVLMASTLLMAAEVRSSHVSVSYEAMRVVHLRATWMDLGPAPSSGGTPGPAPGRDL